MNRGLFRALVAIVATALIGTGMQATAVADDPPTGSVSGHVYMPIGAPNTVANATITLSRTGQPTMTATTASDGSWSIADVPIGTYTLTAVPPTSVDAGWKATGVSVTASHLHRTYDLTLYQAAKAVGVVKDESGNPVEGARVSIGPLSDLTDSNGVYEMVNVSSPQEILIRAEDPAGVLDSLWNGGATIPEDAPRIQTTPGATITQHFVLKPRGHFVGTVTDEAGEPLEGIAVSVESLRAGKLTQTASGTTGNNGTYDIATPSGYNLAIRFSHPTNAYASQFNDEAPTIDQAALQMMGPHHSVTLDQTLTVMPRVYLSMKRGAPPAVKLNGTPAVGHRISMAYGGTQAWIPTGTTTTRIEWLRDGIVIPGATADNRIISAEDIGHRLSARRIGSAPGWTDRAYTTGQSEPIQEGTFDVEFYPPPALYYPQYFRTQLYTRPGTVSEGYAASYRIYRDGHLISTNSSHRIDKPDIGHTMSMEIDLTKPGFTPKTYTSPQIPVHQAKSEFSHAFATACCGRRVWLNLGLMSETVSPLWLDGTIRIQEVVNGKRVTRRTFTIKDGSAYLALGTQARGLHVYYVRYSGVAGSITPVEVAVRALL